MSPRVSFVLIPEAPRLMDWIRIAAAIASMVIQRHRDLELLRASEVRYRQLAENLS